MAINFATFYSEVFNNIPELLNDAGEVPVLEPIDTGIIELLKPIELADPNKYYNPLQVESLLDQATIHINACLKRQEEAQELEDRAVNMALEWQLIQKLYDIDKEELKAEENVYSDMLSKVVGKQTSLSNNEGEVSATENSSNSIKDYEKSIRKLKKERIDAIKLNNDLIKRKSLLVGNALNYLERFQNVKQLFQEDIRQVYSMLKAAEEGLKIVYQINNPLPDITDNGYLYLLYIWLKQTINKLEDDLQQDYEYTLLIPLRVGLAVKDQHIKFYENDNMFKQARNTRYLKITIPQEIFPGMKFIRLRGLNVRIRRENEDVNKAFVNEVWNTIVTLPKQRMSNDEQIEIPKAYISAYTMKSKGDISSHDQFHGIGLYNASPIGEWEIELPRQGSRGNSIDDNMNDIYLEFQLAVKPMS